MPALEELHFPQEWRTLFSAAGIPREALENVESTRTLINIVTETIEKTAKPSDVPCLNLLDMEMDARVKVKGLDDFLMQDSTSEEDDLESKNESSRSKKSSLSARPQTTFRLSSSGSRVAWSEEFERKKDANLGRTPPPPPPPPVPVPLLDFNMLQTSLPQHAAINHKPKESLLSDLKTSIQNPQLKPVQHLSKEKILKVRGQGFDIQASELQSQMTMLKATTSPHPSQLRDLREVDREDIVNLTEILKKVGIFSSAVIFSSVEVQSGVHLSGVHSSNNIGTFRNQKSQ